jgi:protein SCO1/2
MTTPRVDLRWVREASCSLMWRVFFILSFAVLAFVINAGHSFAAEVSQTNRQTFQVKGVVVAVRPAEKKMEIKHEAIPGYMSAMTMPFDVKDTNELAGIEAGDPVSFRLNVTDAYGWIDQLRKTGPKTNTPPTTGAFRRVRDVEPLNEGDALPEYHFIDQFGKKFSTRDFKGQALAITFLFTRCPFPNFCPLMANNFGATQKKLLAMPNAPTNWHLLTISFDPEFDTPAVLKKYAEAHDADPNRSTFATGELIDITAIGEQFGLTFWHEQAGVISHNLRTVVIDASSRVQKIFTGNDWKPEELVAEMIKAAGKR